MIPRKFEIRGSKGIRAGLGIEVLSLDLDALIPEDARTICLRGDNGSGKSTILNLALTPWREPPQLPGALYDHFDAVGSRDLEWTHGDQRFRSRIEIRQTGKTRSMKAYLHVAETDGAWASYVLPDGTISDGKAGTYDACISHILGPRDLYFLSAFRAQNAPRLSDYDDPKGLMRALLALDEIEELRENARFVAKELRADLEVRRFQFMTEEAATSVIPEEAQEIAELRAKIPDLEEQIVESAQQVSLARAELDKAMSEDLDAQRLLESRKQAQDALDAVIVEGSRLVARAREACEESALEILHAEEATKSTIATIDLDMDVERSKSASAQRRLERSEQIEAAIGEVESLERHIEQGQKSLEEKKEQYRKIQEIEHSITMLEAEARHVEHDIKRMCERKTELEQRAQFVQEVPCRGEGEYASCPALHNAMQASEDIYPLEQATDLRRKNLESMRVDLREMRPRVERKEEVISDGREISTELRGYKARLEEQRKIAAEQNMLEIAQEVVDQSSDRIDALNSRRAATKRQGDELVAALEEKHRKLSRQLEETSRDVAYKTKIANDELASNPEPERAGIVSAARDRLRNAETANTLIRQRLDSTTSTIAVKEAEIKLLREKVERMEAMKEEDKALADEISLWELLCASLRGVIDLSIEDAGPAIAAIANDLLRKAYGQRFTVVIQTQKQQQNGKLVECFDISIIDSQTGIESLITHKSGGESVWLDKALTDSVGIYHQQSVGVDYECLFADEVEDGLTEERKAMFWRMDLAMLNLGRFKRKFSISHNASAWAEADYVIDVEALR